MKNRELILSDLRSALRLKQEYQFGGRLLVRAGTRLAPVEPRAIARQEARIRAPQ
jgi:hypothetical protein